MKFVSNQSHHKDQLLFISSNNWKDIFHAEQAIYDVPSAVAQGASNQHIMTQIKT